LTEGAALYASQTKVKSKAAQSIELTLGQHHRKKFGDASLKSLEIRAKDSIYFGS